MKFAADISSFHGILETNSRVCITWVHSAGEQVLEDLEEREINKLRVLNGGNGSKSHQPPEVLRSLLLNRALGQHTRKMCNASADSWKMATA